MTRCFLVAGYEFFPLFNDDGTLREYSWSRPRERANWEDEKYGESSEDKFVAHAKRLDPESEERARVFLRHQGAVRRSQRLVPMFNAVSKFREAVKRETGSSYSRETLEAENVIRRTAGDAVVAPLQELLREHESGGDVVGLLRAMLWDGTTP